MAMKKICVIGNSHIGCIKKAFDELVVDGGSNLDISFYGSPSSTLINTCLSRNLITPTDEKVSYMFRVLSGKDSINIDEYDFFVIHGLFDVTQHLTLQSKIQKYSSAVYSFAFENLLGSTLVHIIELLFSYKKELKIVVTPRPAISSKYSGEVYSKEIFIENENAYSSYFSNKDVFYLNQPQDSLANFFYTDIDFLKNGLNFSIEDDGKFGDHANLKYGKSYLALLDSYINNQY